MRIVVQFMAGKRERERISLVVRRKTVISSDILFYQMGVNTVVFSIIQSNYWLNNLWGDMVPEELRILVVGRKNLSIQRY